MPSILNEEEQALDPYEVLGLAAGAGDGDIKKAYRKMSLKYHPDKNSTAEGAVMFRKIAVSLEILSDSAKRTYIDTRAEADRKLREHRAEMNKKKRGMVDALVAREEAAKKAKVEADQRRKEENAEENIKEAGRRMLEEAQKRAAKAQAEAEAQSRHQNSAVNINLPNGSNGTTHGSTKQRTNGTAPPPISSIDLTLSLSIPPAASTSTLQSDITMSYGPLAHYVFKPAPPPVEGKKKKKNRTAIVEFAEGNWGGCWACWKDHQDSNGRLGEGVKAKWAAGEQPAWVEWASSQSNGHASNGRPAVRQSPPPIPRPNLNGNGHSNVSFDSAPDFASTSMADLLASHAKSNQTRQDEQRQKDEFESMTLFKMRQMERERLEAQIRAEEDD